MPAIATDKKVTTLINVFVVQPNDQQKVVDMLVEATEKTMRRLPGFISASIHKSVDGVRVVNYAQWRSRTDFEFMTNDPEAQAHMKLLMEFAKPDFHLYEVSEVVEG